MPESHFVQVYVYLSLMHAPSSVHGSLPSFTLFRYSVLTIMMYMYIVYRVHFIVSSPGTESSQSSDEGLAASYRRAISRAVHKTDSGVPSMPSQLTTASHSKNQAMTSTASSESESSSGEPQTLKEDEVKVGELFRVPTDISGRVDKRPPQKVPRLSSRKLAQIKVHVRVCMCILYTYMYIILYMYM
jgi:hypothetical protein